MSSGTIPHPLRRNFPYEIIGESIALLKWAVSLIVIVFPSAVCKSKQMSFTLGQPELHSLEHHATDCPDLHMEFLHGSFAVEELLHQILIPPQCHVHLKLLALKEGSSLTRIPENLIENVVSLIVEIRIQVEINGVDMLDENIESHKNVD